MVISRYIGLAAAIFIGTETLLGGAALAVDGTGTYAATVGSSGLLVRGTRATSAVRTATGRFEIDFADNISQCSWVVSIGGTATTQPTPGYAVVYRSSAATNRLVVRTYGTNDAASNLPFHTIVVCDSPP